MQASIERFSQGAPSLSAAMQLAGRFADPPFFAHAPAFREARA